MIFQSRKFGSVCSTSPIIRFFYSRSFPERTIALNALKIGTELGHYVLHTKNPKVSDTINFFYILRDEKSENAKKGGNRRSFGGNRRITIPEYIRYLKKWFFRV